MNISRILVAILLTGTLLLLSSVSAVAGEKVKPRLVIMPFALHAGEDIAYLKDGVRTMLASRIAAKAGVEVVARGEVEKVVAGKSGFDPVEVARTLSADLALGGSITAIGDSVSIDASLIRISSNVAESFFAVAENQGSVIGAVEQLAADVAGNIAGTVRRPQPGAINLVQPSAGAAVTPEQSLHPDRLFRESAPVQVPAPLAYGAIAGAAAPAVNTRSQFLDLEVQVMDVGDVFGEGSAQIVLAEKNKVTVFRQEGNRLVKAGDIQAAPRYVRIIALNLADLNGNGRAEVYISAISDNDPWSYAVEWDGQKFVELFTGKAHYLRPIFLPGRGWGLYGQGATYNLPVKPGIFKADPRSGELLAAEKLSLPASVNLFEFVMGDFDGDGVLETAVQTQDDDLVLYDSNGDVLWRGLGDYGYTKRYIGPTVSDMDSDQKNFKVPARLIALDLDGDSRQELVAMANPSSLTSVIKTIGSFVGGSIKAMSWNGVTFNEVWSSGVIGSYIASYQVSGTVPRLYLAMVNSKSGVIFSSQQSVVTGNNLVVEAR